MRKKQKLLASFLNLKKNRKKDESMKKTNQRYSLIVKRISKRS